MVGKTYCGSQWIRKQARKPLRGQMTLVGATSSDVRDTMVLEGLIPLSDPISEAPEYKPSASKVIWPNGNSAKMLSAEEPERIRGLNNEKIWADELASYKTRDVVDQLLLTLRVGNTQMIGTTTPKATPTIKYLYDNAVFNDDPPQEGKFVRIITGSTYDNIDNLSPAFRQQVIAAYEGTRLGRQELNGELLLNNEGALWTHDLIYDQTLRDGRQPPNMVSIAIGVDPAMSTSKKSDLTGIVVAGRGEDDNIYVLEDLSGKYSPQEWTKKVFGRYDHYSQYAPVTVVVEKNQGGNLIRDTLTRDRPLLPVKDVFSTSSKMARAEPIALLYERGLVWHVKGLKELEAEQVMFDGTTMKSPDRLDAMVFAVHHLAPLKKRFVQGFELNLF